MFLKTLISLAELCRQINQITQNFNNKLKHGTITFEEMVIIAEILGIGYGQVFVLYNGEQINIVFKEKNIDRGRTIL